MPTKKKKVAQHGQFNNYKVELVNKKTGKRAGFNMCDDFADDATDAEFGKLLREAVGNTQVK